MKITEESMRRQNESSQSVSKPESKPELTELEKLKAMTWKDRA